MEKLTIKDILEATGLSQRAICAELRIPINTMNQWCTGKREAPQYVIDLIAEHYKVK